MKTIKSIIKDARNLDPYTPVLALSTSGLAREYQAGELGAGSCFQLKDLEEVLNETVVRPDQEIFDYMADNKICALWVDSLTDGKRRLIVYPNSDSLTELYKSEYEHPADVSNATMLRDAINYIIDMEEGEQYL
jgi:hypothetical protein